MLSSSEQSIIERIGLLTKDEHKPGIYCPFNHIHDYCYIFLILVNMYKTMTPLLTTQQNIPVNVWQPRHLSPQSTYLFHNLTVIARLFVAHRLLNFNCSHYRKLYMPYIIYYYIVYYSFVWLVLRPMTTHITVCTHVSLNLPLCVTEDCARSASRMRVSSYMLHWTVFETTSLFQTAFCTGVQRAAMLTDLNKTRPLFEINRICNHTAARGGSRIWGKLGRRALHGEMRVPTPCPTPETLWKWSKSRFLALLTPYHWTSRGESVKRK
jgi:hypothetical protein